MFKNDNRISSRPPGLPGIPRPPQVRSNSNSTLGRRSTNTSRLSKYEQYLYPQTFETLSSAAPLAANIIYPIEYPLEEEDETDSSITVFDKFERQRKKVMSKFLEQSEQPIVIVSLKSDRLKVPKPFEKQNDFYFQQIAQYKQNENSDDESNEGGEEEDITDSHSNHIPGPDIDENELFAAYSNELIEYDLNDLWFDSMLIDLDEIYPDFLNKIQSEDNNENNSKLKDLGSPSKVYDEDMSILYDDPIQAAFQTAIRRQREKATFKEDEEMELVKSKEQIVHKALSAAELNRQWGFKDPEIGKYIAKFRKQFQK
ncbi:hypothetical protein TRFO_05662 [Tritrichomonas foetus]|uniref:Uncharacterized protein n=1 Tax=Tritrichomonas foetus TaxID=1144522 RepID=A0A1J4K3K6_9EUKA|nr:hypothetical protein TRFO_05662 [Tritrichomonas foetus]|eukprot:OHT06025.1 hypothetical protein TRFO_05662 [Tritrichomonas foetus]